MLGLYHGKKDIASTFFLKLYSVTHPQLSRNEKFDIYMHAVSCVFMKHELNTYINHIMDIIVIIF